MKKNFSIITLLFLFCSPLNLFAEEPPIKSEGWYFKDGINLNGKWFYDAAESYREQDGWAYIEGFGKIHYWLYDTYTYWDGNEESIVDRYVPKWIESMGYVIDFDNIEQYSPNTALASSVKALMKQRNCDVSVALITRDPTYPYVVINSYDRDADSYWTDIIPLILVLSQPNEFKYNLDSKNNRVVITGLTAIPDCSFSIIIPEMIEGLPVTMIDESAFARCQGLISLRLPNSLEFIEHDAFFACEALETVYFPKRKELFLGNFCFANCTSLKEVVIPDGIEIAGDVPHLQFDGCTSLSSKSKSILRKFYFHVD